MLYIDLVVLIVDKSLPAKPIIACICDFAHSFIACCISLSFNFSIFRPP